jgi:hypothetical protein
MGADCPYPAGSRRLQTTDRCPASLEALTAGFLNRNMKHALRSKKGPQGRKPSAPLRGKPARALYRWQDCRNVTFTKSDVD